MKISKHPFQILPMMKLRSNYKLIAFVHVKGHIRSNKGDESSHDAPIKCGIFKTNISTCTESNIGHHRNKARFTIFHLGLVITTL